MSKLKKMQLFFLKKKEKLFNNAMKKAEFLI